MNLNHNLFKFLPANASNGHWDSNVIPNSRRITALATRTNNYLHFRHGAFDTVFIISSKGIFRMTLETYLKDLKAITEKATAGPWETNYLDRFIKQYKVLSTPESSDEPDERILVADSITRLPNAEFIATSRSAIPKLIEVIEVLVANLKWVTADPVTKPDYLVEKARAAFDRVNKIVEGK